MADGFVTFLVIGVVLAVADGLLIKRSGRAYLEEVYGGDGGAEPVSRMVSVLFHLVVLGLLAIVSTMDFGVSGAEGFVLKLGVMLLLVAITHGITMYWLGKIRRRHRLEHALDEETAAATRGRGRRRRVPPADSVVDVTTVDPEHPLSPRIHPPTRPVING
ncbi:hypothetical protein [Goodfellowiella coeruleoviolacea]|uniref:Uncharacterized protein n=1 Tax=Goodfellowiella coeruleoviolacea TaxID=334858 RepID=A0AAE3KIY6_9PSEU|nr:hypothetical protein [Goodfellowiella coeruleoviolacea]MCP2163763.1 hypothetical protein [Goodfellowiella coeruleoviolacea]